MSDEGQRPFTSEFQGAGRPMRLQASPALAVEASNHSGRRTTRAGSPMATAMALSDRYEITSAFLVNLLRTLMPFLPPG